jgi:hypothetical protein
MNETHAGGLRRAARRARETLNARRNPGVPSTDPDQEAERRVERAAAAADARESKERTKRRAADDVAITELDAEATHARQRLALYRRKIYLGRGESSTLAELERVSDGADKRARRARRSAAERATPLTQPKDTP